MDNLSKKVINFLDLFSQNNKSIYDNSDIEWKNKDFAICFKKGVDSFRLNHINKGKVFEELLTDHKILADQVINTLHRRISEGKTLTKIFKDIKSIVNYERDKMLAIYFNEVHRIQNIDSLLREDRGKGAAERLGLTVRKKWLTVMDDRSKPDHLKMSGILADKNAIFTLPDGTTTVAPGLTGES